jgi:hypothetical protein
MATADPSSGELLEADVLAVLFAQELAEIDIISAPRAAAGTSIPQAPGCGLADDRP